MAAVLVFLLIAAIGAGFLGGGGRRDRVDAVLDHLARWLGGEVDGGAVTGICRGVTITVTFLDRGAEAPDWWTRVDGVLPAGYPLALALRRERAGDRAETPDLAVGDPRFDGLFRIDGAPAEVVRRLLGPEVRGYLAAQSEVTLETRGATLRLEVHGRLDDRDARAAIEVTAGIVARLRDAHAAADAAVPLGAGASPYRAIADDLPLREARASRAAEVERFEARRGRGGPQATQLLGYALGAVLVAIVFALLR